MTPLQPDRAHPGAIVPVLAFSGIVVALMQTVIIPLVPRLPALLGASSADTAWVVVRGGGRFDGLGALGISVALFCLLLGISKGADRGWASGSTLGLFAGAVVVLGVWGWYELRRPQPLVDLRTLARRQVLLTNIASAVYGFAMFAMSLVLPQLLQLLQLPEATGFGLGQSMLAVGLVMAPSGLVMMAMAPVSARVSRVSGPKTTLILGALVVAVGYGVSILLSSEIWHFVLASSVIGTGIGLGYGAMPALVMGAVPRSETAAANSLNTLMRSIGTTQRHDIALPAGTSSPPQPDPEPLAGAVGQELR